MPFYRRIQSLLAGTLILTAALSSTIATEQSSATWLRGSGKDLQLCLRGEVFDSDGQPTDHAKVTCHFNRTGLPQQLAADMHGNQFKLWLPVNGQDWYSLWLKAESTTDSQVAYKTFNRYQFRQAAIDGIKLTLQPPTRTVSVKVVDRGQPVSGVHVQVTLEFGIRLHSTTDAKGVARFGLLPRQVLERLTAWTDDHRIGGYSFDREPPRDPDTNEHVIQLSKCRDQKVRFVGEDGALVAGVNFVLQIATPPPNYNFIGIIDSFCMTTNASGEATCRWFPDWDKVWYYPDNEQGRWSLEPEQRKLVDGVAVYTLKKSAPRITVPGHILAQSTDAGGFLVEMLSFQSEREHYVDKISAFTNPDGTFSMDVLPNATYCAYVRDSRWVSKIIDLIPYQSASRQANSPELSVEPGQNLEVLVTSGPKKTPVPSLTVSFRRYHDFTWTEAGRTRSGTSGPQWWVTTDDLGIARSHTLPGKMEISAYTPRWNTHKEVTIEKADSTRVELHRQIGDKRTVTVRLVPDDGLTANFQDAQIRVGSLDGAYEDQQTLTCDKDGSFSFSTFAGQVGVFASTRDGSAAGAVIVKNATAPIELRLRRTLDYNGQLLGADSQPLKNQLVRAIVVVKAKERLNSKYPKNLEVKRIVVRTDKQGNFTLHGIPTQVVTTLHTNSIDNESTDTYVGEFSLEPNESRPRVVSHLGGGSKPPENIPLADRFKTTLRNCAVSGYRPLLIVANKSDDVDAFIGQNYINSEKNKDLYPFMQITVSGSAESLAPADVTFLKAHDLSLPEENHVMVCAFAADGKELGRLDVDIRQPDSSSKAAEFIHQYAPATPDAEANWNAAFAEAKRTNRRVWVRVSQRYCGPCFELSRWLDDHHKLLDNDYVLLKVDDFHDVNGKSVAKRVVGDNQFSIPFHAIFDASGKMLIDSVGPLGNIGCASGIEGKKRLRKMLLQTRQNLSDEQVDQLVASVQE